MPYIRAPAIITFGTSATRDVITVDVWVQHRVHVFRHAMLSYIMHTHRVTTSAVFSNVAYVDRDGPEPK